MINLNNFVNLKKYIMNKVTIPVLPEILTNLTWEDKYDSIYKWISSTPIGKTYSLRLKSFKDFIEYLEEKDTREYISSVEYSDNFFDCIEDGRLFSIHFKAIPYEDGGWVDFVFYFYSNNKVTTRVEADFPEDRLKHVVNNHKKTGFKDDTSLTWKKAFLILNKLYNGNIPEFV